MAIRPARPLTFSTSTPKRFVSCKKFIQIHSFDELLSILNWPSRVNRKLLVLVNAFYWIIEILSNYFSKKKEKRVRASFLLLLIHWNCRHFTRFSGRNVEGWKRKEKKSSEKACNERLAGGKTSKTSFLMKIITFSLLLLLFNRWFALYVVQIVRRGQQWNLSEFFKHNFFSFTKYRWV